MIFAVIFVLMLCCVVLRCYLLWIALFFPSVLYTSVLLHTSSAYSSACHAVLFLPFSCLFGVLLFICFARFSAELLLTWESREILSNSSQQHLTSPVQNKNDAFYARIPSTSWASFVSEVARSNLKKAVKEWKKINSSSLVVNHAPSLSNPVSDTEITRTSSEARQGCTSRFRVNNRIQVLFGSEKRRGVLQPDVQGVHLTGTGFCCTRHQRNPDNCFCTPLTFPTLPYYVDEQHYQGVMVPLLEAEAAVAVMESGGKRFVMEGVRLNWVAGPGTSGG